MRAGGACGGLFLHVPVCGKVGPILLILFLFFRGATVAHFPLYVVAKKKEAPAHFLPCFIWKRGVYYGKEEEEEEGKRNCGSTK